MLIAEQLQLLRQQHQELDLRIIQLSLHANQHEFEIQRLKKQKLKLKDQIEQIERSLIPDIPA